MHKPSRFGLYVHWPFCQAKCPYCDFNSFVTSKVDQTAWRDALVSEIRRSASDTSERVLDTIFFGGGTPSLMHPDTVSGIIEAARAVWKPSNAMEITLEANPTSVEASRFLAYSQAGVNRVSIGVQSLVDDDLRALGRLHSSEEARRAVMIAQDNFDRVSFDLIYARQNQSVASWRAELAEAIAMAPDHLSLYQLTVEDGTAFAERLQRGALRGMPAEDLSADLYDVTQEMTSQAGYPSYEVSNHAAAGKESRHNLNYWRSGDWVGVGPGAHGRLTFGEKRYATETHRLPQEWIKTVQEIGNGESSRMQLSSTEVSEESLMMGLRLEEGVSIGSCNKEQLNKINTLIDDGLLKSAGEYISATPSGRLVLNYILRTILA